MIAESMDGPEQVIAEIYKNSNYGHAFLAALNETRIDQDVSTKVYRQC